jgi:predicted Fe-Mo cluster-binding NifX family protein
MKQTIAIPSTAPGGLEADVSAHFGSCDAFTLVTLEDGTVEAVSVLPVPSHVEGGCMVPVRLLAAHGASAVIAVGMGRRPLLGFAEVGIRAFHNGKYSTVREVITAWTTGCLVAFDASLACGGDASHSHEPAITPA